MSEDEPFIRAILDHPGDDLPRLVYADWLEERGDPRGLYLRFERVATRSGDLTKMLEIGADLDPVWVARVSLPPVGVCCDHLKITGCGPPVTSTDIDKVELLAGLEFPHTYKAFLMNYNGGKVATSHYEIEKSEGEYVPVWEAEWTLNSLLEVGEHFKWLNTAVNLSEEDEFYLPAWYRESALIGRGLDLPDEILLGLDGVRRGRIDIVYNLGDLHTTAPLKPHATTFPGFLSTLPAKRTYSE